MGDAADPVNVVVDSAVAGEKGLDMLSEGEWCSRPARDLAPITLERVTSGDDSCPGSDFLPSTDELLCSIESFFCS
jgi:hypothetical protein